jgi:hypothetical protein
MPAPGMMSRDVEPPFIQNERSRQRRFSPTSAHPIAAKFSLSRLRAGADEAAPFSGRGSIGTPCQRKASCGSRRTAELAFDAYRGRNAEMREGGRLAEQGSGNRSWRSATSQPSTETLRITGPLKAPRAPCATAQSEGGDALPTGLRTRWRPKLLAGRKETLATDRRTQFSCQNSTAGSRSSPNRLTANPPSPDLWVVTRNSRQLSSRTTLRCPIHPEGLPGIGRT